MHLFHSEARCWLCFCAPRILLWNNSPVRSPHTSSWRLLHQLEPYGLTTRTCRLVRRNVLFGLKNLQSKKQHQDLLQMPDQALGQRLLCHHSHTRDEHHVCHRLSTRRNIQQDQEGDAFARTIHSHKPASCWHTNVPATWKNPRQCFPTPTGTSSGSNFRRDFRYYFCEKFCTTVSLVFFHKFVVNAFHFF